MFLLKDHFLSFKFYTDSFLNHSKWIRNERDIWFARKGYNISFSCLNDFFFLIFLFLFFFILFFSLDIIIFNYYVSTTSFIIQFLCISFFLFTYCVCVCVCMVLFLSWLIYLCPRFPYVYVYLHLPFCFNIFFFKWLGHCP
jgi:hypothetical protein